LRHNAQFGVDEFYVFPGAFYSSREDIVISTLLGSCIAVALYDTNVPIGGLNHFMLPSPKPIASPLLSDSAKYGIMAMELLINDMLKQGGAKGRMRAKVFGGSTVLQLDRQPTYDIPKKNIEFVFDFLQNERIPIDSYSVGGTRSRKIYFFPRTTKVLMRFGHAGATGLVRRETEYAQELRERYANAGKPIFF
jgi:chemotaxis protein CheD